LLVPVSASSAKTALAAADAFVALGLKDVDYQYINIDDAWSTRSRGNGSLVPDPSKWPNGITPVAKKIHDAGLKLGMHHRQAYESTDRRRSIRRFGN
jgi:alpha-galactosidase